MKKRVSFFAVFLAVLTMLVPNVSADKLEEKDLTVSKPASLGEYEFVKYDEETNINYYKMTVTVDANLIKEVLKQTPGSTALGGLGMVFFGVEPKVPAMVTAKKKGTWWGASQPVKTIEDAKKFVDDSISKELEKSDKAFWLMYLGVQYKDNNGGWKSVDGNGDGVTSVGKRLSDLTGVAEADLVYGQHYRFYMYETLNYLTGWQYGTEGSEKIEYISTSYELNFPVSGKSGEKEYYFPTLEDAMKSEVSEINVNKSIEVTDDLEIKSGKQVFVKEGVSVSVASGKKITNKGYIDNEGTIAGDIVNDNYIVNSGVIAGNVENNENKTINSYGTITGDVINDGNLYNTGKIVGDVVSDGDFYNEGTVSGAVENSDGDKLYKIELPATDLGEIGVRANMMVAGKTVELLPELYAEGYEFKSIKATYKKDGKDVEIKLTKKTENGISFYTFEMPAGDVKVTAEISKIKNPETYDGILGYVATGAASVLGLIALVFATKFSKKTN